MLTLKQSPIAIILMLLACSLAEVLGACPADTLTCEDCGEEIEPGEEIEIEVETYERGRRGTKIITVCARCYESLYQGGSDNF